MGTGKLAGVKQQITLKVFLCKQGPHQAAVLWTTVTLAQLSSSDWVLPGTD